MYTMCVCVLHISVRADSSLLLIKEIQVLWSQSYATEIPQVLLTMAPRNSVGTQIALSNKKSVMSMGQHTSCVPVPPRRGRTCCPASQRLPSPLLSHVGCLR